MKKTVAIMLVITTIFALSACKAAPVSNNDVIPVVNKDYKINGESVVPTENRDARFGFDGLPTVIFTFSLPLTQYIHLTQVCRDLSVSATVTDSDGKTVVQPVTALESAGYSQSFEVSVGGLFKEDYHTKYFAEITFSFTDEKGEATVLTAKSTATTLYAVAHAEYCDRSDEYGGKYIYDTGNDFSPYSDLSRRYAVLASAIYLRLAAGEAINTHENNVFVSPYTLEYFDSVLTVRMRGGSAVDPELLDSIFLDGKEIYFEIHDGIIRVVLELK